MPFTEWQTNLNPTHKVTHSKRTTNFVEMMEFIEIQGQTEDEDLYGAEMVLYLDEGDVLKRGSTKEKRDGILKYCSQEGKKSKSRTNQELLELSEDSDKDDGDSNGVKRKEKQHQRSTGGSDDELPAVNLGGEPNENLDGMEKGAKGKDYKKRKKMEKKQKSPRVVQGDGGKVKKSRRKSKSPQSDEKNGTKRLKKVIPLPVDSDDEDFDCGTEKVDTAALKEADATEDGVTVQDDAGGKQSSLDDEPMDIASDDEVPVHSVVPDEAVERGPSGDPSRKPTRSLSTGSDNSFNASDIFLSCSQVFKNPDGCPVASASKAPGSRKHSVGRRSSEDEMMPPPPPSLSGLDFLDDIDLSFSTTQLTKTNTFHQKTPQKHSDPGTSRVKSTEDASGEGNDNICRTTVISDSAINDEVCAKSEDVPQSKKSCDSEDLFFQDDYEEDVDIISNAPETKDNLINTKPSELNDSSKHPKEENKLDSKHSKNAVNPSKQQCDSDHIANITDQLVEAWDNFEGDLFGDDDDDIFGDVDTATKTSDSSYHNEAPKETPGRNSPDISRKDVTDDKADKPAECNVSLASAGIQQFAKPTTPKQNYSLATKRSEGIDKSKVPSTVSNSAVADQTMTRPAAGCSSYSKTYKTDSTLEKQPAKPPLTTTSQISNENGPAENEQPKFDLDFDFGDFFDMDDEMFDKINVLPPSPQVNKTRSGFMSLSQVSQPSTRFDPHAKNSKSKMSSIKSGPAQASKAADGLHSEARENFPSENSSNLHHDVQPKHKNEKETLTDHNEKADKTISGVTKNFLPEVL